jgi:hypothetical protein
MVEKKLISNEAINTIVIEMIVAAVNLNALILSK